MNFKREISAFHPGTEVRVFDNWPEAYERCHIRTPAYIRGKKGQVITHLGDFPNPEELAFGREAELSRLYHVWFNTEELWNSQRSDNAGVMVEVFEHWMEKVGN